MTTDKIPYAENLLAYIEQRAEEETSNKSRAEFLYSENIWMRGYIQALKDYNIKSDIECSQLKHQLTEIIK